MNKRLQQFLDAENLTPARLADNMGIQRSGMSHILSARNKPSFDFIQTLLLKYPSLNSEWLITGKGKMYKTNSDSLYFESKEDKITDLFKDIPENKPVISAQSTENKLYINSNLNNSIKQSLVSSETSPTVDNNNGAESEQSPVKSDTPTIQNYSMTNQTNKKIVRITVYYSDGTFEDR